MSDDLAEWLRSQVDYDETLAEDDYVEMDEDYEIMVPAGKIRDAAAEITHLRAALATARREGMEGFGDLVAAAHAEATALQARVAELETALQFIKDAPEEDCKPNWNNMGSYEAGLRYCAAFARAALEGKKDE